MRKIATLVLVAIFVVGFSAIVMAEMGAAPFGGVETLPLREAIASLFPLRAETDEDGEVLDYTLPLETEFAAPLSVSGIPYIEIPPFSNEPGPICVSLKYSLPTENPIVIATSGGEIPVSLLEAYTPCINLLAEEFARAMEMLLEHDATFIFEPHVRIYASSPLDWPVAGRPLRIRIALELREVRFRERVRAQQGALSIMSESPSLPLTLAAPGEEVELRLFRVLNKTDEDIRLEQIALTIWEAEFNTPTDLFERKVTLWDSPQGWADPYEEQLGSAPFVVSDQATSSRLNLVIPAGSSRTISVRGEMAGISASGPLLHSGDVLRVEYDTNATEELRTYGVGLSSGRTIVPQRITSTAPNVQLMRAYPEVFIPSPAIGLWALRWENSPQHPLFRFGIRALHGDIALRKFTLRIMASPGDYFPAKEVRSCAVTAYTDSTFTAIDTLALPFVDNKGEDVSCIGDNIFFSGGGRGLYVIPEGETRWFEVIGDIFGEIGVNHISVMLLPDLGPSVVFSGNTRLADAATLESADAAFIWSPMTHGDVVLTDEDFATGAGITGLLFSAATYLY